MKNDVIEWTEDFYPSPGDALRCVNCGARVIVSHVRRKASETTCKRCAAEAAKQDALKALEESAV